MVGCNSWRREDPMQISQQNSDVPKKPKELFSKILSISNSFGIWKLTFKK